MKNVNFIEKLKGMLFWQNWHPEVALRYLPVIAEIKKLGHHPSVLDVGSGGLGIAPYLGYKVTGIDIRFRPPFHYNLEKIKASAVKIPFADKVFDAVIAVDAFEHLIIPDREKAVKEMLRCARKVAIVAVPCGKPAYLQDKKLSKLYKKKFGKKYHFFEEQLRLGIPEEKDIITAIVSAAKSLNIKLDLTIKGNESLKLREFLMKGWMTKNFLLEIFFRKILILFLPIFTFMNNPPVYRKIFIMNKK